VPRMVVEAPRMQIQAVALSAASITGHTALITVEPCRVSRRRSQRVLVLRATRVFAPSGSPSSEQPCGGAPAMIPISSKGS
jgi:hypothetical protein